MFQNTKYATIKLSPVGISIDNVYKHKTDHYNYL